MVNKTIYYTFSEESVTSSLKWRVPARTCTPGVLGAPCKYAFSNDTFWS